MDYFDDYLRQVREEYMRYEQFMPMSKYFSIDRNIGYEEMERLILFLIKRLKKELPAYQKRHLLITRIREEWGMGTNSTIAIQSLTIKADELIKAVFRGSKARESLLRRRLHNMITFLSCHCNIVDETENSVSVIKALNCYGISSDPSLSYTFAPLELWTREIGYEGEEPTYNEIMGFTSGPVNNNHLQK